MKLTEEDRSELRKNLRLSPRQVAICSELLAKVIPDKAIAGCMGLARTTVTFNLHEIYVKTGARNKTELVLLILEKLGYILPG